MKIHETAIIGENVKIEKNVTIGQYSIISDNTHIMEGTEIHPFAVIGSLPEHLLLDKKKYENEYTTIIGKNTIVREFVTINCGMPGSKTIVKDNCYLMTKSHIGHDAIIEENCVISSGAKIGGHSLIKSFCYVGLNATTHQRSILSSYSIIGAQSFYKGNCKTSGIVWVGVPAIPKKVNILNLQKNVNCEKTKEDIIEKAKKLINQRGQ